jgi:hypothetical protein
MKDRLLGLARGSIGVVLVLSALVPTGVTAHAAEPRFVSILFGRNQWVQAEGCTRMANTVDLGVAATELARRGLTATGNVVLKYTPATGLRCLSGGYFIHPGWDWIQQQASGGWHFASAGRYYRWMTNLTYAQQVDESCGSLPAFQSHGINATGMFAYPNDKYTIDIQRDPVEPCFRWGRTYGTGVTTHALASSPWFQSTYSVYGGRCAVPGTTCYAANPKYRTTPPDQMISQIRSLQPGQWYTIQFYRFVTGANLDPTDHFQWDCTSPDPARHWMNKVEMYCWSDFLRVIDALASERDAAGLVVTDPLGVANAWGVP